MEFLTMSEADDKYGKKGGFGLGLAGTIAGGLALLGGSGLGGLLGGNSNCSANADSQACAFVSKDTFWRQNVDLEKELGVQRYDNLKQNYELYINLDNKISSQNQAIATLNAQLPLMFQLANVTSERYTDDKVSSACKSQCDVNFVLQREIDKKINGTMGLPWGDIISGIPTLPACTVGISCPSTTA